MEIYHRAMLAAGHKPSLKVYNALLSAYGKAQDIEQMTYYVNVCFLPLTHSYMVAVEGYAMGFRRGSLEMWNPPSFSGLR